MNGDTEIPRRNALAYPVLASENLASICPHRTDFPPAHFSRLNDTSSSHCDTPHSPIDTFNSQARQANTAIMAAPSNLPPIFNPTSQDIEMLLAAQSHLGSKNLQVHMEPYLWKTRPDGINVINLSKTW